VFLIGKNTADKKLFQVFGANIAEFAFLKLAYRTYFLIAL